MSGKQQAKHHHRVALAAAGSVSLAMGLATHAARGDAVAELVEHAAGKNAALMQGDMERWAQFVRIAPDFTLMQPFGGAPTFGFDSSPERMAELSRFFRHGKTDLEVVKTYASDAMVVLVMIEHQRAEVGGLPEQDWSLRVTEIYRKASDGWQLVHRHADPLTHHLTLNQAAAVARGLIETK